MNSQSVLLSALEREPGDDAAWLALADALEEENDPRSEATRLSSRLRRELENPDRVGWEERLRELATAGVLVCLPRRTVSLPGGVNFEFVLIPPGSFVMGSPEGEWGRDEDEGLHRVTLTRGFFLGVSPITQEQWRAVFEDDPSEFRGQGHPVERAPWEACVDFCARLGTRSRLRYRLPTEAEWEYACRAGTTSPFFWGENISTDLANYDGDFTYGGHGKKGIDRRRTTPVGTFPANAWGLLDMHGNVYEWCSDWYGEYRRGEAVDPVGPDSGPMHVLRGGSWYDLPRHCRSASRSWSVPAYRRAYTSCRLVLELS